MSFPGYSVAKACPNNARSQKGKSPPDIGKVISSFNTWAYKREQPSDPVLLNNIVQASIDRRMPLEFILYWGKGPRSSLATPDEQCLDYLAAFAERVTASYAPGARITLIFTDTHAALNGHSSSNAQQYFAEVEGAATLRGFEGCELGDLVSRYRDKVKRADVLSRPIETMSNLTRSASRWYRGVGGAEAGAAAYYDMNMLEKKVIEAAFPQAIFITFNGSDLRELFPDRLPVFYMYSLRKGFGIKPWFLNSDGSVPPVSVRDDDNAVRALGHATA